MAGKRQANRTSFKPGAKPGPGRPKGSKNVTPSVRDLVNAVVEANTEPVKEAYRRAATNPKSVLAALDLKARVNREVGPGATADIETPDGIVVRLSP